MNQSIPNQVRDLLSNNYFSIDGSTTLYSIKDYKDNGDVVLEVGLTISQNAINKAAVNDRGAVELLDQNQDIVKLEFFGIKSIPVIAVPLDMHGSVLSKGSKVVCVDVVDHGDDPQGLIAGGLYTIQEGFFEDGLLTPMVIINELRESGAMFSNRFIAIQPTETTNDFNPC